MKKAISIFPKEFGFFPYIFLVYTIMPFLSLLKESGVKQGIGYGMLLLFVAAYRQLFCSVGKASFTNIKNILGIAVKCLVTIQVICAQI